MFSFICGMWGKDTKVEVRLLGKRKGIVEVGREKGRRSVGEGTEKRG
jgi:hypothetical protein